MVNGLYTARNGMMLLQEMVDNTTHNLANANTAGFKKSLMASMAQVDIRRNDEWKLHQDEDHQMAENFVDYSQGSFVGTGNSFDVAIEGNGFFSIQTDNGVRYTRNGSFTRNGMGELTNLQGNKVLDVNGSVIQLDDAKDFSVSAAGMVTADGVAVGQLAVVDFADKRTQISREGYNLYRVNNPEDVPEAAKDFRVKQGFVEASNVNVVEAMVEMIRFQRNYELDQKAVQSSDETLQKAVNEVGRVG